MEFLSPRHSGGQEVENHSGKEHLLNKWLLK